MATNGVPIKAIINRIFIVFDEADPLWTVMLLAGSDVEYNRYGNTSTATMMSKSAMVIEELINAKKYLPLLICRGILAIANTITIGTIKKGGLCRKKSLRCGT